MYVPRLTRFLAACLGIAALLVAGCVRRASGPPASVAASSPSQVIQIASPLNVVRFANAQDGWAAGDRGTILRTSDAGLTWIPQISNTSTALNGLWFEDARTGHAVGDRGVILVTLDGGESWSRQRSGVTTALRAVQFVNAKTGFVAGGTNDGPGVLLKTTDGGRTWRTVHTFKSGGLFSISFSDVRNGWAVGMDGTVSLSTDDGGMTWRSHRMNLINTNYWLLSTQFRSAKVGWVVGGEEFGTVQHTVDGGGTWDETEMKDTRAVNDICMVTDDTGWAVGSGGAVYFTESAGDSWQRLASGTQGELGSVSSVDARSAWAVGWSEDETHGVIVRIDSGKR